MMNEEMIDVTLEDREEKNYYQNLLQEFNNLSVNQQVEKQELLAKMLKRSNNSYIESPFYANWGGKNLSLGDDVYINSNFCIVDDGNINIGSYTVIGPNVNIYTVNHPMNIDIRRENFKIVKEVNIGENVWIGGGTIILPGVSIGDNAVIGAGSVVTKDIPNNMLACGNPCKIIRDLSEDKR